MTLRGTLIGCGFFAENHLQAFRRQLRLQGRHRLGEERVANRGHDDADDLRGRGRKSPRHQIGNIAQGRDGAGDLLACRRGDGGGLAQVERDRGRGDLSEPGHVHHRYALHLAPLPRDAILQAGASVHRPSFVALRENSFQQYRVKKAISQGKMPAVLSKSIFAARSPALLKAACAEFIVAL